MRASLPRSLVGAWTVWTFFAPMAVRCRALQTASAMGSQIISRWIPAKPAARALYRQYPGRVAASPHCLGPERTFAFGVVSGCRRAHPRSALPALLTRYGHASKVNEESNDDNDTAAESFEPTWTYTPYKPPPPSSIRSRRKGQPGTRTRQFSTKNDNFRVPDKITVPENKVEMSFVRSSGAGGQNVNKLSTKVEVRLRLADATFIPREVRDRIATNEKQRINKDGFLFVTSQEYRTQAQNRKDAMRKLEDIILKSYPRPVVRKVKTGVSKKAKERNKEFKRKRSQVKANRKRVDF